MKNEYMEFDGYKKANKKDDGFGLCCLIGAVGALVGYVIGFGIGHDVGVDETVADANSYLDQIAMKAGNLATDAFCTAIETTTPSVVDHLNALTNNEETMAAFKECVHSTFWKAWNEADWHFVAE